MGLGHSARLILLALLLLTACGSDGLVPGPGGGSDSGESGADPSDPLDPIEGEGAVPPGRPDPDARWVSPSTLGNGLVHDTRSRVDPTIHTAPFTSDELAAGVAWSSFVDSNTAMLEKGFRPAQVDATVMLTDELELRDDALYISDDDANYRTDVFTHVFDTLAQERNFDGWEPVALGARPTSIQPFAVPGHVGYSVAWVYDSATMTPTIPWVLKAGLSSAELLALLADPEVRPLSLASRRRAGTIEYAVILVPTDSPQNWLASVHVQTSNLATEIAAQWQEGFYPFRMTTQNGDPTRVDVLWTKRPPGISVQVRLKLTDSAFEDEDASWRSRGYHLETADEYVEAGEARRVGVWVRYEPYLRWKGTKFVPGDMTYATKYEMFHEQALRIIGNFTEIDCSGGQPCPNGTGCYACPAEYPCFHDEVCVEADYGEFTRPSATLHIFEGDELVLNRAYTFAPSVYADTPLTASFKVGSVAKSLTATAVVRELDLRGLSMNTSFAEAIGVSTTYPLEAEVGQIPAIVTVRVRDVLDNQGGFPGFTDTPISYLNDAPIVGAGATIPVDGQELFEYVFAPPPDGRVDLGLMHNDTYWQSEWFIMDRQSGTTRYSNAGYSVAGEVVRVQSGIPYDEYIASELLTPLDLQDRIYPDPGSRVRTRGPTLVSVRNYLVDTSHPYNVGSSNPEQPGIGFADNPMVDEWWPYMGPAEPRAPVRATSRYGGRYYLGGAPLAAGGWWADGDALGHLIRTISRTDTLLPLGTAAWLWHPALWNFVGSPVPGWAYVHGWYVRGNWVAWMGSDNGAVAVVMHNRMYDMTVVFIANGRSAPSDFINPLMASPNLVQGFSRIGLAWPCISDPSFGQGFTGCNLPGVAIY